MGPFFEHCSFHSSTLRQMPSFFITPINLWLTCLCFFLLWEASQLVWITKKRGNVRISTTTKGQFMQDSWQSYTSATVCFMAQSSLQLCRLLVFRLCDSAPSKERERTDLCCISEVKDGSFCFIPKAQLRFIIKVKKPHAIPRIKTSFDLMYDVRKLFITQDVEPSCISLYLKDVMLTFRQS